MMPVFAVKFVKPVMVAFAAMTILLAPAAYAIDEAPAYDGYHAPSTSFTDALHQAEDMTAEVTHHHADAHHAEAHGSGGLPQFDITTFPSQLFWLVITFFVMYFVFSKRFLPKLSSSIETRRTHIQSDLETAERLQTEAEEVQTAYEDSLSSAHKESGNIMNTAIDDAKREADSANAALRAQAETEVAALNARLEKEIGTVRAEMDTIAAEVAHLAAEKVFGISTDLNKAKNVVQSINAREAA